MSAVANLTTEAFVDEVIESPVPVVVDFYANWCGPCRLLAPVLERIADAYQGRVRIVKVDVDQEPELAGHFGVSSIPTLAFFQNGRLVDRHAGLLDPRVLLQKLDRMAEATSAAM